MYFIYFSTLKIDLTMNIKHLNLLTFSGVIRGLIVNVSEKYILAWLITYISWPLFINFAIHNARVFVCQRRGA